VIVAQHQMSYFSAISWCEKVTFDEMFDEMSAMY